MSCLALSLTLISAFMPVPPAQADQAAPPPPVIAQASPEPMAPPPAPTAPPPAELTSPSPSPSPSPAPAPGYVVAPPPSSAGLAPQLKGLSVWGILPYAYYSSTGLGLGGRFMIPLSFPPLLHTPNVLGDGFALEFGADYLHWSQSVPFYGNFSVNWFLPSVGVMWNVWLNEKLVLYPKFSLGYYYAWVSNLPNGYGGYGSNLYWDIDLGAMYKLDNGLTLRAELGYSGLKLGVGWLF